MITDVNGTEATALDLDCVRAFVLVSQFNSFTRAAEALETTQAAVSLKIQRLESRLGYRLFDRTPRNVALSAHGAAFIDAARELSTAHERALNRLTHVPQRLGFGISEQIAGPDLPQLLTQMHAQDRGLLVEFHLGPSRDLLDAFDEKRLDAVIVRRVNGRRDGKRLFADRVGWFAAPHYQQHRGEAARLVTLAEACAMRREALRALDDAGIPWAEVFVGGGIAAVTAAVTAGVGIGILPYRVVPPGAEDVRQRYGLPALSDSEAILHSRVADARLQRSLRTLIVGIRAIATPSRCR